MDGILDELLRLEDAKHHASIYRNLLSDLERISERMQATQLVSSGKKQSLAMVRDMMTAMNAGDKGGIQAEIGKLEQLSKVLLARTGDRSRLEDGDLSTALFDFTQAQNALQAATALGARIFNISILNHLT